MARRKIERALISVYDKTGIVGFARALVDDAGIEILSTGGTAKLLTEGGIPVTMVEDVTGCVEMLDGRVKTLHPRIHAAILADRDNPDHMRQLDEQGIKPIDMVVINLYPFEEMIATSDCTFAEAIGMIDIGGPCLLRAAAKNHKHVLAVHAPDEAARDVILRHIRNPDCGGPDVDLHSEFAMRAFEATAAYDERVSDWLRSQRDTTPHRLRLSLTERETLRYGENPHQEAGLYVQSGDSRQRSEWLAADSAAQQDVSYNNYVDAAAALELCRELTRAAIPGGAPLHTEDAGVDHPVTATFIKHTNACGVGVAPDPIDAYRLAYLGDPNAAMGGILAVNCSVNAEFAQVVMDTYGRWGKEAGAGAFFVEVWIASKFTEEANETIRSSKKWGQRVRLLKAGDMMLAPRATEREYKSIPGGLLVQSRDRIGLDEEQWQVATRRHPSERELRDLRLAWLVCKHTKSNAVTICKDGMLIGNGAGQMSRVMSCRMATWLAKENGHAGQLEGAAAASDAFFPFADGPDQLIDAGVTAIIQPGGSRRDADTVAVCNERGVAMILTGTRHFRH